MQAFMTAPGTVLVHDGAAFGLGRVIVDQAELLTLAVDPAQQGRGSGRRCLRLFLDASKRAGATRVFLEVAATNQAALALYRSEGFTEDGLRKGYYRAEGREPVDAILMSMAFDTA